MALVVLPEGQQRSGKQGGIVWSHNRGGPYCRSRAIPVNPNSDRQVAVRNAVQALAIRWATVLTAAKRATWDTYAANVSWTNRLGKVIQLTGMNHYIRSNTEILAQGDPTVDEGPSIFTLAEAETLLVATASEATQIGSFAFDDTADWCSEDGAHQYVYGGLPKNASRSYFSGPYQFMLDIPGDGTTPVTSPQTATWPFPFAEDQKLWCRTRILRADGRLSEFSQANFLALA